MEQIKRLFGGLEHKILSYIDPKGEYSGIAYNHNDVKDGYIFVAIKGFKTDGHNFIPEAVKNGAKLIVVDREIELPEKVTIVKVDEPRAALSKIASNFYGWPQKKLKIIGVTGTNGKTTTAYLLYKILGNSAVIGTLGVEYRGKKFELASERTTPESSSLIKLFSELVNQGVEYVVMEVSSHSLSLNRVAEIEFEAAIFTNLTEEHLDFHKDMESYYHTKERLFDLVRPGGVRVINADDPYGATLLKKYRGALAYSMNRGDTVGRILDCNGLESFIELVNNNRTYTLNSSLLGGYNLYNIMAAFQTALALGLSPEEVICKVEELESVEGRFELVSGRCRVIIDFAHTPDGLRNLLETVRGLTEGKVISIFGHGGGKCKKTRYGIATAAAKLADYIILTSDNPRDEDPQEIVDELERVLKDSGFPETNYAKVLDRERAINYAFKLANPEDIVVISGKGHENYQIVKGQKTYFSDKEVAEKALNQR